MNRAYLGQIERAFLQHAGRGLMLSPRDNEYVVRWERAGVPTWVVIGGIRVGFANSNRGRAPSRLAHVVPAVERAIKAWREGSVGTTPIGADADALNPSCLDSLVDSIADAGRRAQDDAARDLLREAWRVVDAL